MQGTRTDGYFYIFTFFLSLLIFLTITQTIFAQTAKDLEGEWLAEGYTCEGVEQEQRLKVISVGNLITAIKITGDACVPPGEITWQGILEEGRVIGSGTVSRPNEYDYSQIPVTLTIVSNTEVLGGGFFQVMRRDEACRGVDASGVFASSAFNSGRDGWRVSGDVASRYGVLPDYKASGGNGGGFIEAEDEAVGGVWYFDAPSDYHGNLSCAYGGSITFDLKQSETDSPFTSPDIEITGQDGVLTYTFASPPGTAWTGRSVPLTAEAGWMIGSIGANEEDIKEILSSVTGFRIRGEYRTGEDTGGMDNVMLKGPGPGTVAIAEEEEKKGSIFGTVTLKRNGKPVKHEYVTLIDADTSQKVSGQTVRLRTGAKFDFGDLEPGNYMLSVGGALTPYTDETSSKLANGLKKEERREVNLSLLPRDFTVSGRVYGINAQNKRLAIKNAEVEVAFSDGKSFKTNTSNSGSYRVFYDNIPDWYTIKVTLKDKDGIITVQSYGPYNKTVVDMKTKKLAITKPFDRVNLFFKRNFGLIDGAYTVQHKRIMRDAGSFYANSMTGIDFARNKLKVTFNHQLPVDQFLYTPGFNGARYFKSTSYIETGALGGKSGVNSGDTPDNREYHEFGHHVNADASIMGNNTYPNRAAGDTNHGGANNSVSTDSMVEGFAEFFALMVKNGSKYKWAGTVTNLQKNYHTVGTKPDEEFNVAALLWDLVDSDTEAGDYFKLGSKATWDLINDASVTTVRALYLKLNTKYKTQDTNKTDKLSDVDALFVLHRFYSDKNKNGKYDAGEAIGFADYYNPRSATGNPPRQSREAVPGTLLEYTALDQDGNAVAIPGFIARVYFEAEEEPESYPIIPEEGATGVRVFLPYGAVRFELDPDTPGYDFEPFTIGFDDFWAAVDAVAAEDGDVFASHTFQLTANDVAAPMDVFALATDDGVRIGWASRGEVVVVRGASTAPATAADGFLIFEGADRETLDSDAYFLEGATVYYSVFGRDQYGRLSAPVSVSVDLPGDVEEYTESSRMLWLVLAGGAGIGLIIFLLWRRRRNEEKKA